MVELGPGRFEAWVKAKPMEGRANAARIGLLALACGEIELGLALACGSIELGLARSLRIQPGRLRLVKGGVSRQKVLYVI